MRHRHGISIIITLRGLACPCWLPLTSSRCAKTAKLIRAATVRTPWGHCFNGCTVLQALVFRYGAWTQLRDCCCCRCCCCGPLSLLTRLGGKLWNFCWVLFGGFLPSDEDVVEILFETSILLALKKKPKGSIEHNCVSSTAQVSCTCTSEHNSGQWVQKLVFFSYTGCPMKFGGRNCHCFFLTFRGAVFLGCIIYRCA